VKLRFIGNAPFFSALSHEEHERISEKMHLEHHRKGEMLFRKGDDSGTLYLVKTGWVRLMANGGTALASQGPGALVGETDLFLDQPRSFGAMAATDLELWALGREDLITLIADNPQTGIRLSLAFGQQLALFEHYLVEQRLMPLDFFSELEGEILATIASRLVLLEKNPGEFVVESGQPPQALFIVETGRLHLHSTEEGGDFCELGPGESFGEMAVLTGKPHGRSVQAADSAVLWMLSAADFETLSEQHPQIRLALSKSIREHLLPEDQTRAVGRLAEMPLFSGLAEDVLWAITERLLLLHVPAREMVFAQGQRGDAVYVIDSGQIEIFADEAHGRTIKARLGGEEFFGEMALLTGKPRSTGARATTHTNLWALYRSDFDDLVNRYPSVSMAMSRVLSERLRQMDQHFTETHFRSLRLLASLTPAQLEDVGRRLKAERYRQGETIIREGEPGHEMYFIESGRARMLHQRGDEAVLLDELQAGDLFGEMALLTGKPRWTTVTALTDLNLWRLSQADFDELVTTHPNLALALSRLLSERLRKTESRVLQGKATPVSAEAAVSAATAAPGEMAASAGAVAPRRRETSATRARRTRERTPPPRRSAARRPAPRRSTSPGLVTELGGAVGGLVAWFGALSPKAKVRLILFTMALVWLLCIATPYLVISTLAADDVTNLEGAIAFVQTSTPLPTDPPPPTDLPRVTDTLEPPVAMLAAPAEPEVAAAEAPEETEVGQALEGAAAASLESEAKVPTEAPTATPWIVVITNTPPPPTDTPIPTDTPVPPTATPKPRVQSSSTDTRAQPTATPAERPKPPRDLDPRLGALNVSIVPAGVRPGQSYWRLIRCIWQNKEESGNDHTIYINVLDENGSRIVGQPIEIRWDAGSLVIFTEDKPPTEWSSNFPMYGTLGSYSLSIAGLPSDTVAGMGMGTPEQPNFTIHTNFLLVFQRTTY
jgi:CRP-like cAMP-binding protein